MMVIMVRFCLRGGWVSENLMCSSHKDNRVYRDEWERIFRSSDIKYPEEVKMDGIEALLKREMLKRGRVDGHFV